MMAGAGWGATIDPTSQRCRDLVWREYLLPNYVNQGVRSFWLDETEMQSGQSRHAWPICIMQSSLGAKIARRAIQRAVILGDTSFHLSCLPPSNNPVLLPVASTGMDTSLGPAAAYGNYWPNAWIQLVSDGLVSSGTASPITLTRAVWAGAARLGTVLWSSDIWSTFEELAAQVPEGVAASLSGIPYWTTDTGGFGCPMAPYDNDSPYMRELIVRWHQFGVMCPVYRTHGCRNGSKETLPADSPCTAGQGPQGSCGGNEIWSYGPEVEVILTRLVRLRNDVLKDYVLELAVNVSRDGVATMRPLWYEFPADPLAWTADETLFMLGPKYLVAPVVALGQRTRTVYFPAGSAWADWENSTQLHCAGPTGLTVTVPAPLEKLLVFQRLPSCSPPTAVPQRLS